MSVSTNNVAPTELGSPASVLGLLNFSVDTDSLATKTTFPAGGAWYARAFDAAGNELDLFFFGCDADVGGAPINPRIRLGSGVANGRLVILDIYTDDVTIRGTGPQGTITLQNGEINTDRDINCGGSITAGDVTLTGSFSNGGVAFDVAGNLAFSSQLQYNGTKIMGAPSAPIADATGALDVVDQLNALLQAARDQGWLQT